jgi:hypothetical protein
MDTQTTDSNSRASSPVPCIEVRVQLRPKNSIIKEIPQDYRLLIFRNHDFFCFNQIEEDFNIPLIIVHASNIHHLQLNTEKNKFHLFIKNKGCYTFRVKDQETAQFIELELNKLIKKFKNNFPNSPSVDEKELLILVSKMLAQSHASHKTQSFYGSRMVSQHSHTPSLHQTIISDLGDRHKSKETVSLIPTECDVNPLPVTRTIVSRVFGTQKQRLLEIEKLVSEFEKDPLIEASVWIGMVHHYKMSNITGDFHTDDDISNYTTPFLAVIFTSKPLNYDYSKADLQTIGRAFDNNYWRHLLPSWMEPNNVYLFDAHEKHDFRNLVSVFPYSYIIPLM